MSAGKGLKQAMGAMLLVLGVLMLSGYDKVLEAKLVAISPDWLTSFSTRI